MNKTIKIVLILAVILLTFVGGYFILKNLVENNVTDLGQIKTDNETGQPILSSSALQQLIFTPIVDYWIQSDNDIYALTETGQVITVKNGEVELINSQTFSKIHSLAPSFDGEKIILEFNFPDAPRFNIFNTTDGTWQGLPSATRAAAWSPNSLEIAYLEGNALKILEPKKQTTRTIISIFQPDAQLKWVEPNQILINSYPSALLTTRIWSLNLKTKSITPFLNETGAVLTWSNDKELALKLRSSAQGSVLSLFHKTGTQIDLNILTLPEKCELTNNQIYCGVPKIIREGLTLLDDYYQRNVYFDDNLYLIDLTNGTNSLLLENPGFPIDVSHPKLTSDNQLLFINRYDNKLYTLKLK
ncbi:MAG TPA: hypothetical protein VJH70_03040 [Candidatus Paceibacterota bacterium]